MLPIARNTRNIEVVPTPAIGIEVVADFYCNRAKLVIELDGGIHDKREQREKDYNRDQIINSLGLRVLRIRNEELFNMPAVLEKIFAAINNP